jgi:glutathione synthase/RimK-type ligase-like ATP-grasp enzyme
MADRGWERGFVKPAVGATSRETLRFDATAAGLDAAQAHVDRLLRVEDLLLQPYLASVETAGEISMVFVEDTMTHAVRRIPVAGDYRTQDDFGAADEPTTITDAERAVGERALAEVGHDVLYARVDLLRGGDGAPLLLELELVEPSMFFRHAPHAADRLAEALGRRLG